MPEVKVLTPVPPRADIYRMLSEHVGQTVKEITELAGLQYSQAASVRCKLYTLMSYGLARKETARENDRDVAVWYKVSLPDSN